MWHNEGFVTDRQLTLDEAMTLAGHRYTIEMHDVAVNLGNEDEPYMVKTPEYRAIVRKDTGKIFGIASRGPRPILSRQGQPHIPPYGVICPDLLPVLRIKEDLP